LSDVPVTRLAAVSWRHTTATSVRSSPSSRDGHVVAIDQTALPHEVRMFHLTTADELVDAITRWPSAARCRSGVVGVECSQGS
jgi:hypothetical protein